MNELHQIVEVEIDPLNPAQVFACCGILELLAARNPAVTACFKRHPTQYRRASFELYGVTSLGLKETLKALKRAQITTTEGFAPGEAPVELDVPNIYKMTLDWWLVPERTAKSRLKLWAGQQSTIKLVQDMLGVDWGDLDKNFLMYRLPMSGRFGLDPRSAWNTLDFGSSPNTQNTEVFTYPAAEMLAAVGLQGFRPRASRKQEFIYRLWERPLPVLSARAAVSGALPDGIHQAFSFQVEKRSGSYSCFAFAQPFEQ